MDILNTLFGEGWDINTIQQRLAELLDIQVSDILDLIPGFVKLLLLAGPLLVLALGLYYFLAGPKEATYRAGYRFRWGMGSVQAWQFMQKLAGIVWMIFGLGLTVFTAVKLAALSELALADMLWQAIPVVVVQAVVMLVGCGIINVIVFARYDLRGRRRYTWKELLQG